MQIIPLLLQSLDVTDEPALWLSTLNTVYDLMHDASDAFTSHIGDFIPRLSLLIRFKSDMVRLGKSCNAR